MKKVLAIVLALVMISSLVAISFAQEKKVDFMLATDLHFQSLASTGDLRELDTYNSEDIYFDATIQGQMSNISEAIIRSFFKTFESSDREILLIAGDLTDGSKADHEALADIMGETLARAKESGKTKRIFVINGNHDIDKGKENRFSTADEFKSCYGDFGYSTALAVDPASCSYVAQLNEYYRLLAVDSCVYGDSDGELSESRFAWIREQAQKAKDEGAELVVMLHHNAVPHFSVQDIPGNFNDIADKISSLGVKHVFTGHLHANDIALGITPNGNNLYDVLTGSVITTPNAYRNVSVSPQAVDITTDYITSVDVAYLPKGLSLAQRQLIANDFPAYAKNFFSAGMSKWLDRYIGSAAKLAKKLKIQEGTVAYKALDYILGCVGDTLNLPLYEGENTPGDMDSFEELCGAYGYTLPKSDYKVPGDVVGAVAGAFYAGDENIKYTDKEVQIVYSVLSAGIVYAVAKMYDIDKGINLTENLFKAVGLRTQILGLTKTGKILAGKQLANMGVKVLASPLVEGFTCDKFAPADLNTSLPGVEVEEISTENTSPMKLLEKIMSYFKDMFRVLKEAFAGLIVK